MSTRAERLNNIQISIVRSLFMRGGAVRPIALDHHWQRKFVLPLWHRGLIEIWLRQSPREIAAPQGPFYFLTVAGARLAEHFVNPAPRGFSGAEQST
jgi:hypothetical protein